VPLEDSNSQTISLFVGKDRIKSFMCWNMLGLWALGVQGWNMTSL